jgi:hypothetical protein
MSRRRKKQWHEEQTSENLPRLIPADLERLSPESKEALQRMLARLKASKATAKAERELLDPIRKKLDHLDAIRMGLIPSPWMKPGKSKPKPGSAANWIDALYPNGEWRLKSAKAIERDIKKLDPEGPSYRSVARELKTRR